MKSSDLISRVRKMKPLKGQNLTNWLARFLIATPDQLSSWKGTFTEVTTTKVVEILRRRGVVEEHTLNQSRFGLLINAVYRASAENSIPSSIPRRNRYQNDEEEIELDVED